MQKYLVLFYRSNFLNGKTPTVVELHWHVHPVDTVSFTHDGTILSFEATFLLFFSG